MMIPDGLATSDPLGLGGLLADAWRVEQLVQERAISSRELRDRLIDAALDGLHAVAPSEFRRPASSRLAFRELGLAIGLAAVPLISGADGLSPFVPLRDEIEAFWLDPANRRSTTWLEHRHINEVMLATSLVPDGYLTLADKILTTRDDRE
jgi:hypothetical protein